MQVVGNHAQDHLPVIVHLAFNVVIIGARYQQGDIHQVGGRGRLWIVQIGGMFCSQQPDGGSGKVFFSVDFLEKREQLLRHSGNDGFEDFVPQPAAGKYFSVVHIKFSLSTFVKCK